MINKSKTGEDSGRGEPLTTHYVNPQARKEKLRARGKEAGGREPRIEKRPGTVGVRRINRLRTEVVQRKGKSRVTPQGKGERVCVCM